MRAKLHDAEPGTATYLRSSVAQVFLAKDHDLRIGDGEQILVTIARGVVHPRAYPDLGRPRTDDSPALVKHQLRVRQRINCGQLERQIARAKVHSEIRRDHKRRHANRRAVIGEPLNQDTVTMFGLLDWLVTVTIVADRTRPPACEFMYVTR
jgi:hypothetical protein